MITYGQFLAICFINLGFFVFGFSVAINLKCVKIVTKRGEGHDSK